MMYRKTLNVLNKCAKQYTNLIELSAIKTFRTVHF